MNTTKKALILLTFYLIMLGYKHFSVNAVHTAKDYSQSIYNKTRWQTIQNDYLETKTDRLIFVKYKTKSEAAVEMWKKVSLNSSANGSSLPSDHTENNSNNKWKKIVSCKAYVGQNGLGKQKQGDHKTPVGIYNITMAFGRKKSPGTAGISYTKLNKYHYWSTEKSTYNTFVDVRTLGRTQMSGEHLISYNPWYNYALALDYNKKCTYLKGSAIFLHCTGKGRTYTMGCIAVSQKNMKKIVKNTTQHTKICIYRNK
ncbi:MAG: L,D-transpeptidase family protein [Clostridium sp.]|nr:L,D-transpeptidase family protein [Clostridium sp.]